MPSSTRKRKFNFNTDLSDDEDSPEFEVIVTGETSNSNLENPVEDKSIIVGANSMKFRKNLQKQPKKIKLPSMNNLNK